MKWIFLERLFKAGHDDANVAHIVGGICRPQPKEQGSLARINIGHDSAGALRRDLAGPRQLQPALALIQNGVSAGRITAAVDGTHQRFGVAAGLKTFDPAVFVQLQCRAFTPGWPSC